MPAELTSPLAAARLPRRLQSELMGLMRAGDPTLSAFPDGDNIFQWTGTITGGVGTVCRSSLKRNRRGAAASGEARRAGSLARLIPPFRLLCLCGVLSCLASAASRRAAAVGCGCVGRASA